MLSRSRWLPLAVAVLIVLALAGCGQQTQATPPVDEPMSDTYYIFDTIVTVKVYDSGMTKQNFNEIEQLLQKIDKEMNRQRPDSEISQVNKNAGQGGAIVSEETFGVVKTALDYAARTGGRFDPTVGPLVDLWGIGHEGAAVPGQASLSAALKLVGYQDASLDESSLRVTLARPGMSIDLGAIAKGYAADVIAKYLESRGFHQAIIDLGGNVLALGSRPDGSDWRIGIQDPGEERGNPLGVLELSDKTVVTSGIYERFFIQDNIVYHHILDTRTGCPVENNLLSVTIITDQSERADAMSTSVFALGLEEGMKFVEANDNMEAIFVTKNKKIYLSAGLKGKFELTREDYRLAEWE
ncbi:FAD:protein FMN transferase [Cohnella lubricantis]|uniref:FAD:protein FMN transferase n=1 Tax=Cohnella lubricantis TaxID=2163172 RepID=A0A841TD13_9BACL|nr:FAD:protein FMN transferase [Cohnella lubricantis]MBB6679194.1 FAD:protein FMN transferase [Cohnella lubricantis]MBP2120677.1 thiamine biosynthesis lipoprotein [Cohnella lubricantis]